MTQSKNYSSQTQNEFLVEAPTGKSNVPVGYIHGQRDEGYQQAKRRSQQKAAYRSRAATVDVLLVGSAIVLSTAVIGTSAYIFSQGFSLPNPLPRTSLPDDSLQRRSVD